MPTKSDIAAVEPEIDYAQEPTTLVKFELEDHDEGTLLKLTESGFDHIPQSRRLKAFRMDSRGWDEQMGNIETFVKETTNARKLQEN